VRRPALLTVAIATSLLLAGCSADPGPAADPTASPTQAATSPAVAAPTEADIAALAAVVVEGPLGALPTVTFDLPFTTSAPVARLDVEGTGAVLEDGQSMTVQYAAFSGDDGSVLGSTWEDGSTQALTVGDDRMTTALNDVLKDQRVGARILFAVPGTAATETAEAQAPQVIVLEVTAAQDIPDRASGQAVEPPAGLPVVTLADNGEPSITIPADAQKPTELVVQTLIKGEGPVITAGQNITVQYNGWLWDGTLFDSSWQSGQPMATPIGAGQLIPGWDEGLVGQTIGSQVLLVIPPAMGYGPDGYNEIPGDATLIFVIDLLAVA